MRRLTALLIAAAPPAFAQTTALANLDPARSSALPPTGVAIVDNAFAIAVNPAALAITQGLELDYVFERSPAFARTSHAFYFSHQGGGFAQALEADWTLGPAGSRRLAWGLAIGSEALSLGVDYHWLASRQVPDLEGLGSLDVGILSRPLPFLALGAAVYNVDQPAQGTQQLTRAYAVGLGVRPFGERLTLAIDAQFDDRLLVGSRLQYTALVQVVRGLQLSASFSMPVSGAVPVVGQVGLAVELSPHVALGYAPGGTASAVGHVGFARWSNRRSEPVLEPKTVALLDLPDLLRGSQGPLQALGLRSSEDPFIRLIRAFAVAEADPKLHGVILKIDELPDTGMGKIDELRQAVLRLRKAGKTVIAVVLKAQDPEYLLASAADHVFALPQSMLQIDGLRARAIFFGGTMEKLGVSWDVARVGAYKNSPDQLTRTDMSPEQREALDAVLSANFAYMKGALAPRLDAATLDRALSEALIPAQDAVALHLVEAVITPDELDAKVAALIPGARFEPRYEPFFKRDTRWGRRRQIAIIPVLGSISGGSSRQDPFGGGLVAGAQSVVETLGDAARDPEVEAIVLRIDSPGGDGLASDLIYRAVLDAKKQKPVIASMGDTAASGGYYSAMGADEIFASPTTITGSIGVFFIKPAAAGLLDKLGIHQEALTRGPHADFSSEVRPWTPDERRIAQHWVDAFYDQFIAEAAKCRKTTKAAVDAVARGRIWSGQDALARGLVDRLGGLHDAIAAAKARANIPAHEPVEAVELGAPTSIFAAPGAALAALKEPAIPRQLTQLLGPIALSVLLEGRGLALAPYGVVIR